MNRVLVGGSISITKFPEPAAEVSAGGADVGEMCGIAQTGFIAFEFNHRQLMHNNFFDYRIAAAVGVGYNELNIVNSVCSICMNRILICGATSIAKCPYPGIDISAGAG